MKNKQALTYYRGDTYPLAIVIKSKSTGQPLPISGFGFTLTVDQKSKPEDNATQIFTVAGTITDANNGRVEFDITSTHTDIPVKKYYYDVQMTTDANNKKTIMKSTFTITQDITKS